MIANAPRKPDSIYDRDWWSELRKKSLEPKPPAPGLRSNRATGACRATRGVVVALQKSKPMDGAINHRSMARRSIRSH